MATPTAEEIRKMTPEQQSALLSSGMDTLKGLAPLIQADSIGQTTPLKYPQEPAGPSVTDAMGNVIGNLPTPQPEMSEAEKRLSELTKVESQRSQLVDEAIKSLDVLRGRGTSEAELRSEKGTQQMEQRVQDLTSQINAIQTGTTASKLALQEQGRGIPQAILSGQASRIERDNAIKALTVSAQLQAVQGNLQLAETQIKNALDLKYAPELAKIQIAKDFLELNKDIFTEAQKVRADEVQSELDRKEVETKLKQKNETDINNLAIEAARNGAPTSIVNQMTSSTDAVRAAILGASYLKGGLESIAKTATSPESVDSLVQAVIDNPSIYNDLTATTKGKIASGLANAGFTGFGKPLSDAAIKEINQTQGALTELSYLKTIVEENRDKIGPITGLAALNPYSEARKIQADIDRIRQTVGKALEGGVLRKEDEEKYKKILATLTDTPSTAIYKIDALIGSLQRDIENYTTLQGQAGRNIGGIVVPTTTDTRTKYGY